MRAAIWARTLDGSIGKDGDLIVFDSEDLQRFKSITMGHPMVMGRKTFESLPKILPGRLHVVLTNDLNYISNFEPNPNVVFVLTVQSVLEKFEDFIVIGGAETYKQFMPHIDIIYETIIYSNLSGDVFAPRVPYNWLGTDIEVKTTKSNNQVTFITWRKHGLQDIQKRSNQD